MSNWAIFALAVAVLVLADTVRPVVPKVVRALDDFHAMQAKVDEGTKAVNGLRESISNVKFPKWFSEQMPKGAQYDED